MQLLLDTHLLLWAVNEPERLDAALVQMLEEAMQIAARERALYDTQAAELGGWSPEVVQLVADQNLQLRGEKFDIALTVEDRKHLKEAMRFVDPKRQHAEMLFGEYLLDGVLPGHRK